MEVKMNENLRKIYNSWKDSWEYKNYSSRIAQTLLEEVVKTLLADNCCVSRSPLEKKEETKPISFTCEEFAKTYKFISKDYLKKICHMDVEFAQKCIATKKYRTPILNIQETINFFKESKRYPRVTTNLNKFLNSKNECGWELILC
jgi:hypothetical protein